MIVKIPHETALARAREIAKDLLAKQACRIDEDSLWPERGLRALQDAKLGGLVIPESAGGLGHGLLALAQVCEVLGMECASTSMCFGMHSVATAVIAAKVTPDQIERYLEPISQGKHLTTLALSEPGTGSHFYFPQTKLLALGDHYLVTGEKSFVTNGAHADSYVVSTVAADPHAPVGQFSCVVLPEGSPGMTWREPWKGLGMRGNASSPLQLKNVRVPKEDLLGKEGDQIWYVFEVVSPYFLIAMAGTYLGIATAALEEALEHLKKRHYTHGGASPGSQPVIQHRLGSLWGELERTRRLIYHAALQGDLGAPNALLNLLSAKAESADCVVHIVNEVMTLMGGISYGQKSSLGRHLRDARAAHVMAPTTDILRTWLGRALLGVPLLGD